MKADICDFDLDLNNVILGLYVSEINCGLQTFWDGGVEVWLGDDMNGRVAEVTLPRESMGRAAWWLHHAAIAYYPMSIYVRGELQ